MKFNGQRQLAIQLAWKHYNTPYIWGGDDFSGLDCSGLYIKIFSEIGLIPMNKDYTADGLYNLFHEKSTTVPYAGCLVFWGGAVKTHVEMMINANLSIGARGGGSKTKTIKDSIKQNAFVKLRPITSNDKIQIIDPFT